MADSPVQMRSDIASVLSQMRNMRQAVQTELTAPARLVDRAAVTGNPTAPASSEFAELFKASIDSVNELQQTSSSMAEGFVRGEHKDLVGVMIASQKSSVAFQALTQVRNRMVSAYQDIMNMPI